jgi:hypothetical protein
MDKYIKKSRTVVAAEQVAFTDEEKEAVLRKQNVAKYGGIVKVTRPGDNGEDAFHVGLSVDYSFVLVPEGDYLVTDLATGKRSVWAKDHFEREFEPETKPEESDPVTDGEGGEGDESGEGDGDDPKVEEKTSGNKKKNQ